VNNAAKQGKSVKRFEELEPEMIEQTFKVNVVAQFPLTREACRTPTTGAPFSAPGYSLRSQR
jgi:NAD(P)-dependent dehydrogenase (short-subunit alcohol dehydrogenase family)